MPSPYSLVDKEYAVNWITTHRTPSQMKASFGDPQDFNAEAHNSIIRAHNAVGEGLETVERLVRDPTRTEVSKHAVAKEVASKTVSVINQSATSIGSLASTLNARAIEMVGEAFAVDANSGALHSEIRGWIRDTAKAEGGIAAVRDAMGRNKEVAAVLYHSPDFLLGMSEDMRATLATRGIEKHAPKAFAMLQESQSLSDLSIRYGQLAKSVERSFYNPLLAEQAKLRVEVD